MKISLFYIVLISLECLFSTLSAQRYFRNLSVEDGLSQNSVVSIAQDSLGYLWLATQQGLNRYNGEFKIFPFGYDDITHTDYKELGQVYVDSNQQLWTIDKNHQLYHFSYQTQTFKKQEQIPPVKQIYQVQSKDFWLIGLDSTIWIYDSQLIPKDSIIISGVIIHEVSCIADAIAVLTSDGIALYSSDLNEGPNWLAQGLNISSVTNWNNDRWYIGTFGQGLYQYSFSSNSYDRLAYFPSDAIIYDILVDHLSVYIATYGDGLYIIDSTASIAHYVPEKGLKYGINYHDITCLYRDREGVIWIGTDGEGVDYYDRYLQKFNIATDDVLSGDINLNVIRAIAESPAYLFFGTSGLGLTIYNKRSKKYFTIDESDGLTSDRVMSLYFDGNMLWVGTQDGGLNTMTCADGRCSVTNHYLGQSTIWKIFQNRSDDNKLWIGTQSDGLIYFDKVTGKVETFEPELNANKPLSIRDIHGAQDNHLWVATEEHGLFLFNVIDNSWKAISESPRSIKSLAYFNNYLLVGTDGQGLWMLEDEKWRILASTETGLANNVVYGILGVTETQLWLSSNRGLSQISNWHTNNPSIRNFEQEDGLQSYEFNTGAYYESADGTLYFGGIDGYNWFMPSTIPYNFETPYPIITGVSSNGEALPISQKILLNPNQDNFQIEYASMQLSLPQRSRFMYRLLGYDDNWISSDDRTVSYMNMPAGDYIFQLKAANYDDVWSEELVTLLISIREYWYLTWWFKLIVVLVLIALLYSIMDLRRKQQKATFQLAVEQKENEFLEEMNSFRTKMIVQITHEIRTPLTIILGSLENLNIEPKSKKLLERNSHGLMNLADQMLELTKIKSSVQVMKEEPTYIIEFCKMIVSSFDSLAASNEVHLRVEVKDTDHRVLIDQEKLRSILSNLLMNAIKHTPHNGEVLTSLSIKNQVFTIRIQDTGSGIDPKEHERIVDWFYKGEKNKKEGFGLGLSIVHELVKLLEGEINFFSDKTGTVFYINLPLKMASIITQDSDIPESSVDSSSSQPVLLIVEDNKDLREYMLSILQSDYQLVIAVDGCDGLNKARSVVPDLIVTDIMMPSQTGIDMIKTLRNERATSHIPILIITALASPHVRLEGIREGADGFLLKPFDPYELKAHLETILLNRSKWQAYYQNVAELKREAENEKEDFVQILISHIDTHIHDTQLDVAELTKVVFLERTQLYRKTKALTGFSPSQLIRHRRMKRADQLLRSSTMNISEVADAVGYRELSYFSKVYKDTFGKPPSKTTTPN